jgi:YggT family protein
MGAQAANASIYLINTLFNLYMGAVLLRIVLQWVRADFYNPISQLVWKITQPVLAPVAGLLPRSRKLDIAASLLLLLLAIIYVQIIGSLWNLSIGLIPTLWYSVLKIISLGISIYTASIIIYAILSWFGPGLSNPSANILYSINEPLLRPIRKIIPPLSGLDLSPLVAILLLQVAGMLLPLPGYFGLG